MTIVTKTITAQNTFTDPIKVGEGGIVDLSITGTFTANVVVQRRRSDLSDNAWATVATYTEASQQSTSPHGSNWEYRVGVETGGFTSGTIVAALAVK